MTRRRRWLTLALFPLVFACVAPQPPPTVEVAATPTAAPQAQPSTLEGSCERGTAHLLSTLRAPMEVTAWVTRGSPKLDAFVKEIDEVLKGYERLAPGKLRYRMIEVKTDDERQAAKAAGLAERIIGPDENGGGLLRGFLGIGFRYRAEADSIPFFAPDSAFTLRFWLANKVREMRDRAEETAPRVAVLTGKDEISIRESNLIAATGRGGGPSLRSVVEQALPFYKLIDANLEGGKGDVDANAAALIITQPGKDFTEKELRRIDQFLMRGKSIAVFAGAVNIKASDATMTAELSTHGLEKLLDGYGIELRKDAVLDWESSAPVNVNTQSGLVTVTHSAIVRAKEPTLDQKFPGFFLLDAVAFPFPSTLVPHPDRQPGATLRVVARTSARSTALTTATVDMKAQRKAQPGAEYAQRAVAIAIEGKIRSAFAGRPDPAVPAPVESTGRGRLLVVASAQFLANPWARAGNPPPMPPQMAMMGPIGGDEELMMIAQPYATEYLTSTILVFKNTLDWMTSDEDLIACSALLTHSK